MLLEDKSSLLEICEALAARGYRMGTGTPLVTISASGRRSHRVQALSRLFHNWFYAGWVVVSNEWANIPPKTVRGEWEPVVTTEEFERGLAILARRQQLPVPKRRHFYLLQGLIVLRRADGQLEKLTCSMPNANRARGGVPYYCIPSSNINFLCQRIDDQLPDWIRHVQVDAARLPLIRQAYRADIERFTGRQVKERQALEAALVRLETKELNMWRAFTEHGMRPQLYEQLAREYAEERTRVTFALNAIQRENKEWVANLDAALTIIAHIGERYIRQSRERQRQILRHVVKRVVINPEGQIVQLELHAPFTYLQRLAQGEQVSPPRGGGGGEQRKRTGSNTKRTSAEATGSLYVSVGSPNGGWGHTFTRS